MEFFAGNNNSVTAAQWQQEKHRRGKRIRDSRYHDMLVKASIKTFKFFFRGFKPGFEQVFGGTVTPSTAMAGYYPLTQETFTAADSSAFYALPVYLLEVTGGNQENNPKSQSAYAKENQSTAIVLWRLGQVTVASTAGSGVIPLPVGTFFWVPCPGQINSGTVSTSALLQSFVQPQNQILSSAPVGACGPAAMLNNVQLDMNVWGCTNCASKIHINEVRLARQDFAPEYNTVEGSMANSAALPSLYSIVRTGQTGVGIVAGGSQRFQDWWQGRIIDLTTNPIAKVPKVNMRPPYSFERSVFNGTVTPKTSIESDTAPEVKTIRTFGHMHRMLRFDGYQNIAVPETTPTAVGGSTSTTVNTVFPSWGTTQGAYPEPVCTRWQDRKFVLIEAMAYSLGLAASVGAYSTAAAPLTNLKSSTSPSFDLNLVTSWSTL